MKCFRNHYLLISIVNTKLTIIFIECEKMRRRKLRIVQVRNQTNAFSKRVRSRVEEERVAQLTKIGKEELEKFVKQKENELAKLEQEYQHALADIGMGHKGVREQEEYEKWKKEKDQRDRELAQFRGDQALKKINYQQVTENKIKENKINLKKCIALNEKLRAAEIRADKGLMKGISKVRVVEIDAKTKEKKVRFLEKGKVLKNGTEQDENVRRIPLSNISTNGVEAAIREQEMGEKQKWAEEKRQIEIAKIRGEAALRKLQEEKENQDVYKYQSYKQAETSDLSQYTPINRLNRDPDLVERDHYRTPTGITSGRYGYQSQQNAPYLQSDLDHFPVRGPSSIDDSSGSSYTTSKSSNKTGSSDMSTPITDAVVSRYPTDNDGRPLMGGPESAFKDPKVGERSQTESLDDKETTVGTPTQGSTKTNEGDRDFISKVLKDFDFEVPEGGLKVKIDVQESSTINSVLSVTQEHERTSQGDITRTTFKSSTCTSLSSSSSIDITKEKFLSEQWRQRQIKGQVPNAPGYDQLHRLINQLESQDDTNVREVERQNKLRAYIERVLQMKRKEIDDLSISDVSSIFTTDTSSFKESSNSLPHSSTSSPGSQLSMEYQNKQSYPMNQFKVNTSRDKNIEKYKTGSNGFVSSTPTSILSSSDSKSSASKTVRFADDDQRQHNNNNTENLNNMVSKRRNEENNCSERRGSYEGMARPVYPTRDEVERQRKEIINRTKLSLSEIRNFYEAQRLQIELELQKRKLAASSEKQNARKKEILGKQSQRVSPSQLSEGPLSTESDSYGRSPINDDRSGAPHDDSQSSQKESSLSSNNNTGYVESDKVGIKGIKSDIKRQRVIEKILHIEILNKTSSSGTTTSSSNATAELLSRIRRMEIPALQHPPHSFWTEQKRKIFQHSEGTDLQVETSKNISETKELGDLNSNVNTDLLHDPNNLELIKYKQTLGEKERKRAGQSMEGVSETVSFSSFQFSEQEILGALSEEYSSITLSSDDNENVQ